MTMRSTLLACIALIAFAANAQPARRALLIGIDDYTASTLPVVSVVRQHPGWPDLRGAANDVSILSDMLVLRYGFERTNIVTLTNQQATRAAILRAIEEHLVRPARNGDIVFYYFAGHGAQVPNAVSDEPDRLDESIVPADSRRGADDIRDKELRPLFNRILEHGAHLTLLLDHCHSAGGFRRRPDGIRARGIAPAPPIIDRRDYGPRPDARGALILASAQDFEIAWEAPGDDGRTHGAFTWAWIRAMRDAMNGEAAQETFLRAQARLRGERADQAPAMLGNVESRQRPFLGLSTTRHAERAVIAVEAVLPDGDVVLQGGWAHGLAVDSELVPIGSLSRLRVTRLLGLGRSVARVTSVRAANSAPIRPGALLEIPSRRSDDWFSLTSPHEPAPYHLAIRDERTKQLVSGGVVFGRRVYSIVLRAAGTSPEPLLPRYYYVFVIDSHGNSHLVFPTTGSSENRFPMEAPAPAEIPLGDPSAFRISRPYGMDTYVLLSTEEPLPNPSILEWDGVRARRALGTTPWSIERITLESVAPRRMY
jgi:Caspase domain